MVLISSKYYVNGSNNLTLEKNENIQFSEVLPFLQQDLKFRHGRILHIHPTQMLCLEWLGVITRLFIEIKDDVLLCYSSMFGTYRIHAWRTKGEKLGSIRKYSDYKPGSSVSIVQLLSIQPGLVSQVSGKLTSTWICSAQLMVDQFGDSVLVHLMRITIQEETLIVKEAF